MNAELDLDRLDGNDDFFKMSYGFGTERLEASIRLSGLIQPLLVEDRGGGVGRIVSGFRRYRACSNIGIRTVPVIFAEGEPEPLYRAAFLENVSHRDFNLVESSLALNRLARWHGRKALAREFMPLLGLDPSDRLLSMVMDVKKLDSDARQALVDGRLNLGDVPALLKWSGGEQLAVLSLFLGLRMGANVRREVACNLFEIEKRDGVSPTAVLSSNDVVGAMGREELSVPQKAGEVRWLVRKRRYPELTRLEESFTRNVKALRLPPGVSVQHPPGFEGEHYRCTFAFRSNREFSDMVSRLEDVKHEKILPE